MKKGAFRFPMIKITGGSDPDPAVFCPAEGYILPEDCPVPDPNIICPVDGWIKPENPWTPPVVTPIPSDEEIILLCNRSGEGVVGVRASTNVGGATCTFELYNASDLGAILHTQNCTASTTYSFQVATYPSVQYFIVKIRPTNPAHQMKIFRTYDITGYTRDWPIIYADFRKAPNMYDLAMGFQKCKAIKRVDFPPVMDILFRLYYCFEDTLIPWVQFPSSLPALQVASYLFNRNTECYICYFPKQANSITTLAYAYYGNTSLQEHKMPETINNCTTLFHEFENCSNLRLLQIYGEADELQVLGYFVKNCAKLLSKFVFPEIPKLTSIYHSFYGCALVPHIEFTGDADLCADAYEVARGCTNLLYFKFPSSMAVLSNMQGAFLSDTALVEAVLPNYLGYNGQVTADYIGANCNALVTLGGDLACGANTYIKMQQGNNFPALPSFNKPQAKFNYLGVGATNGGPLTYCEVDWAGSPWANGSCITLKGSLSSGEIDRIFTALPSVGGTETIDVRLNSGYAGCTKSIATAKGWTVL